MTNQPNTTTPAPDVDPDAADEDAPPSIEELLADLFANDEDLASRHSQLTRAFVTLRLSQERIERYLSPRPGGPWDWDSLPPVAAAALWADLFHFVHWLDTTYLRFLPQKYYALFPCWYRHPIVVQHLTALMVAHRGAYHRSQAAPGSQLVDWHERSLWPTIGRLRDFWGEGVGCTAREHHDVDAGIGLETDMTAFEQHVETLTGAPRVLHPGVPFEQEDDFHARAVLDREEPEREPNWPAFLDDEQNGADQ